MIEESGKISGEIHPSKPNRDPMSRYDGGIFWGQNEVFSQVSKYQFVSHFSHVSSEGKWLDNVTFAPISGPILRYLSSVFYSPSYLYPSAFQKKGDWKVEVYLHYLTFICLFILIYLDWAHLLGI